MPLLLRLPSIFPGASVPDNTPLQTSSNFNTPLKAIQAYGTFVDIIQNAGYTSLVDQ
jgi:hypothetical protein